MFDSDHGFLWVFIHIEFFNNECERRTTAFVGLCESSTNSDSETNDNPFLCFHDVVIILQHGFSDIKATGTVENKCQLHFNG